MPVSLMSRVLQTVVLLLIMAGALAVSAQEAKAPSLPAPAPFTEVESLRIQNLNLKTALVQRAIEDLNKDKAVLKADIEKARPGYAWDPETGQFSIKATPK